MTIKQWFETTPDLLRPLLLANLLEDRSDWIEQSLHLAISNGFMWDETPEGAQCWSLVYVMALHFESGNANYTVISPVEPPVSPVEPLGTATP